MASKTTIAVVGAALACGALIVVAVVVGVAVGTGYAYVETNQVCLVYNTMFKTFDDVPLHDGRHYIGHLAKLLCFPRTVQTIVYANATAVHCLSREGMRIVVDAQVGYRIDAERAARHILLSFGTAERHRNYVDSLTRAVLKDVCARYDGEAYFLRRAAVNAAMRSALEETFPQANASIAIEFLQLLNVDHPDAYEQANRDKEAVQQDVTRVLRQREERVTAATTRLLVASIQANATLARADATARAIVDEALTAVPVELKRWEARAAALQAVVDGFVAGRGGDGSASGTDDFVAEYARHVLLATQHEPIVHVADTAQ